MKSVSVNWGAVYNRLFKLIDTRPSPFYYSGPTFIEKVQEVREEFPNYGEFIANRRRLNASASRRDYFKDIFLGLNERERRQLVSIILDDLEGKGHPACSELRIMIGGIGQGPQAAIPPEAWNSERLNNFLKEIDLALSKRKPERCVTLAYTCFEGFLKAFVRKNIPAKAEENEIVALSKLVKHFLKEKYPECPNEALNMITQAAHAVNRLRDGFSESHFGEEADPWTGIYIRDVVNTQIRLLLNFM